MEKLAYSINETAECLSLGRTSIYSMIADGRLETFKLGRRTLVKISSIKALVGDEPGEHCD
ncbi:MAG: helix-turn-helix domain-containing protein [Erythrobacter sp.]